MVYKEETVQSRTLRSLRSQELRHFFIRMQSKRSMLAGSTGFTLIELVAVVIIIAIIGSFAISRVESINAWKYESDIRKLANTWETLFQESFGRGDSYRLTIDLDSDSYSVRREIPVETNGPVQVDYLAHFRTDEERKRRQDEQLRELPSVNDEFQEEDRRQSGSLDALFYQALFADPYGQVRLGRPLQFPSLAEPQPLTQGLAFKDVRIGDEVFTTGVALLRFSPRGTTDFAIVHLASGDEEIYTLAIDPATGKVSIKNGYHDVIWSPMNFEKHSMK